MIGLVAATGFTGRLIARELKKAGLEFFIAARNERLLQELSEELGGVPTRVVNVKDSSTFGSLNDCTTIINCAGPFVDLGEPIVQAAIAQKSHYLDLTGEQSFIKLVYDKYHEQAKAAGICLVPACAFEYAIGDALGAMLFSELPSCNQIEFIYHVDGMYTSAGTRKSIIRACGADGFHYRNNRIEKVALGSIVKTAMIEGKQTSVMTFPAGESLMLPRHIKVPNISTFMSVSGPAFLIPLFAALAQTAMKVGGDLLVNSTGANAPTLQERENTKFLITANAKSTNQQRTATVSGRDPYFLTAVIIAGVAEFLSRNGAQNPGAVSPSMVGTAELIRNLSTQAGAVWTL